MTPEELLRPRYKVIASYPSMKSEGLSIGQILTCRNYDNDFSEKLWCEMNDAYPHLFKKLEWWEERKREDLPEYVKCINTPDQIHKPDKVYKVKWGSIWGLDDTSHPIVISTNCYIPATLTDYQNQSK